MKILQERFPKGTIPGQRTDGRYIDGKLWENISFLAKKVVKDMTWLTFISSSTLEVGTGKSVFAQQLCEAYLEAVRQHHGIDNRLEMKNIVFTPEDLIERSFKVPKFSCIILDEWEDAHYWSKLGMTLRKFFRRCRQLNLFMVCIIPNFFELTKGYAISRSIAMIDVKFDDDLNRGNYSFYSYLKKKDLYLLGKKTHNYGVVKPDFNGRFVDGYVVDEKQYRRTKYLDLAKKEKKEKEEKSPNQIKKEIFKSCLDNVNTKPRLKSMGINIPILSDLFGITKTTGYDWLKGDNEEDESQNEELESIINTYDSNRDNSEIELEPEEEEDEE